MSEKPRISGVHWYADHGCCRVSESLLTGASKDVHSGGGAIRTSVVKSFFVNSLSTLPSILHQKDIDQVRVVLSSTQECWVQRPEPPEDLLSDGPWDMDYSAMAALLLGTTRDEVVDRFIHPLGNTSPLTIWMRSEFLERLRRQLPQQVPVLFLTEPALAPILCRYIHDIPESESSNPSDSVLLFVVASTYVSAFWVKPSENRLRDAMRIPFQFAEDVLYLAEQAAGLYPWLKGMHDRSVWIGSGFDGADLVEGMYSGIDDGTGRESANSGTEGSRADRVMETAVACLREFQPALEELLLPERLRESGLAGVAASLHEDEILAGFEHVKGTNKGN